MSQRGLAHYEALLRRHVECDWQTAELFLAVAKNPNLREFCLFLLEQIGRLTSEDRRFEAFLAPVCSAACCRRALPCRRARCTMFFRAIVLPGRIPCGERRCCCTNPAGASSDRRDPRRRPRRAAQSGAEHRLGARSGNQGLAPRSLRQMSQWADT